VNTFDRHLLREWLQILGLALAVLCGLLMVQVCYNDLRELRDAGGRGLELWHYVFVNLPSFFPIVLPISLLLSLLFVLTKLHRANEFTAMRAVGVGFLRLTAPIWAVGVLCCGLAWWLNATVAPWSVERSRAMMEDMQFRHQATTLPPDRIGAIYSLAFENPDAGRVWFFNRYSQSARRGYGVQVSQLDAQRRETDRIIAAEAWRDAPRGGWVFQAGRDVQFDPETGSEMATTPFREKFVGNLPEDPQLMLLIDQRDKRPIDLSFFELRRVMDYFALNGNPKGVPYAVRYYSLIADTLGPLIVLGLAIPFAVTGVRVNPAVAMSKSIGLFFLYYLVSNLAGSLASKQLVDPALAAWLPDLGMAALAVWLFARLR
jgi:lipopolysaccharide export system permease protein